MGILNSIPNLDSGEEKSLVTETLIKINAIIENACEYYKIYHQNKIHTEVNKQINSSDEENEFLHKTEEEINLIEKNTAATINNSNEKRASPKLLQQNTIIVAEEASQNLARLINEFEKKEQDKTELNNTLDIKKKIINQAKQKEEGENKSHLQKQDSHFKQYKKNTAVEVSNRLDKILKIPTKKPEVDSIIKRYLNKSGEFKEECNHLMKSQKMIEEDIKKVKRNVQELV